jgi:hypothetical protein
MKAKRAWQLSLLGIGWQEAQLVEPLTLGASAGFAGFFSGVPLPAAITAGTRQLLQQKQLLGGPSGPDCFENTESFLAVLGVTWSAS